MRRLVLLAACLSFLATPRAEAAFLNGTVEYDYLTVNLDVVDAFFTAATTITSTTQSVGDVAATTSTGDFIPIVGDPPTLPATIVGLKYNPPTAPVGPFATFVGEDSFTYSFFITSFSDTIMLNNLLAYAGLGYWTTNNPAFQQTLGSWTLTASRTASSGTVSYNAGGTLGASGVADVVPEPASMLLLGSGLLGLAAARRRRQARKL